MRRNLSGADVCSDPIRHRQPPAAARYSPVRKSLLLHLRQWLLSPQFNHESHGEQTCHTVSYQQISQTVQISPCSTFIQ